MNLKLLCTAGNPAEEAAIILGSIWGQDLIPEGVAAFLDRSSADRSGDFTATQRQGCVVNFVPPPDALQELNGCLPTDTQDLETCNRLVGGFISGDPSLAIVMIDLL